MQVRLAVLLVYDNTDVQCLTAHSQTLYDRIDKRDPEFVCNTPLHPGPTPSSVGSVHATDQKATSPEMQ
jgi:hypothetical protein